MKKLLYQCGLIAGLALGLTALPNAAQAGYYHSGGYYGGSGVYINVSNPYRYHYRHHQRCFWVGGYWRHGIYYPAHRVCRW